VKGLGYCLVMAVPSNLKLKETALAAGLLCFTEYIVNISLSGGISYMYTKVLFDTLVVFLIKWVQIKGIKKLYICVQGIKAKKA
jgi:hypothetical protein